MFRYRKRGLAILPTKFGIAFTFKPMNQAGALVSIYLDGSIGLAHGGVEMGQGLHTKMCQVAANALGVPPSVRPANLSCFWGRSPTFYLFEECLNASLCLPALACAPRCARSKFARSTRSQGLHPQQKPLKTIETHQKQTQKPQQNRSVLAAGGARRRDVNGQGAQLLAHRSICLLRPLRSCSFGRVCAAAGALETCAGQAAC